MEDVDEPRLTVSGAARRLGIAPATLRTWDRRYGVGPAEHTRGRHRTYSAADMARLEVMQHALVKGASPAEAARYARAAVQAGLGRVASPQRTGATAPRPERSRQADRAPDPGAGIDVIASLGAVDRQGHGLAAPTDGAALAAARAGRSGGGLRMPGVGTAARGLARAALALDPAAVRRIVEESIDGGGLAVTWDEVVRPVLDAVDARIRRTGRGVEVARLLEEGTAVVFHARAYAAPPPSPVRPVLVAGMPGDEYGVPLAALGAVLAERRIASRSFGPALPAPALVAAIRRVAPAAVVLWAQLTTTADVDVVAALPVTRPRFRTYVAGPGWEAAVLPRGVERLSSLTDAADRIGATVLR
jgi:MerR family transcriptional regulator, light-induced transcriptional regulator